MEGCEDYRMVHAYFEESAIVCGFAGCYRGIHSYDSTLVCFSVRIGADAFREVAEGGVGGVHVEVLANVGVCESAIEEERWCHERPT